MSLFSKGSGGAVHPSGAVALFNREDIPLGYTPISGVAIPAHLYSQPRTTLITPPSVVADIFSGHWLTDYESLDHIYLLHDTVLRRFNPFTGDSVQLASCPISSTGTSTAVATRNGIYVYGTGTTTATYGRLVYRYDYALDAWSQVASLPSTRYYTGAVYVEAEESVYLLGGTTATTSSASSGHIGTVVRHDLRSNSHSDMSWSLPSAWGYRGIAAGAGRLFVWGGSTAVVGVVDTSTGAWTAVSTDMTPGSLRNTGYALEREGGTVLMISGTQALVLEPGSTVLNPSSAIAGVATVTPRSRHSVTGGSYSGPVRAMRYDTVLTCAGGQSAYLALTSLSALDEAPRGRLFFARKN